MPKLWTPAATTLLFILCLGCSDGNITDPPIQQTPAIQGVTPFGVLGLPGEMVSFAASATGQPTQWSWSFGKGADPANSDQATPIVKLGVPGEYRGSVTATNAGGASEAFEFTYGVRSESVIPGILSAQPSGLIGTEGTLTQFVSFTEGEPLSWRWNFGGGASPDTSWEEKPSVRLGSPGSYTGILVVGNERGESKPFIFRYTITHDPPERPDVSAVTPDGFAGRAGDTVSFEATGSGEISDWVWSFGGGARPNVSTDRSPSVRLGEPGEYQGTLVVSNGASSSEIFYFVYQVSEGGPVVFSVAPTGNLGEKGSQIQFSAQVEGTVSEWNWDFGDGVAPRFSTEQEPEVTLASAGNFDASLTVSNGAGEFVYSFHYQVEAENQQSMRIEDVSPSGGVGQEGDKVTFRAIVSGGSPTSWLWHFDGAYPYVTRVREPEVELLGAGGYTGHLVVTSSSGETTTSEFTYRVEPGDYVPDYYEIFGASADGSGMIGDTLLFYVDLAGKPVTYEWEFGGGVEVLEDVNPPWPEFIATRVVAAGRYSGKVRVANQLGRLESNFVYTTHEPEPPSVGENHRIARDARAPSIEFADGRLYVTYYDRKSRSLQLAISKTESPESVAEWDIMSIENSGSPGEQNSVLVRVPSGGFMAAYTRYQVPYTVGFSSTTDPFPSTLNSWSAFELRNNAWSFDMIMSPADRPVVAYEDYYDQTLFKRRIVLLIGKEEIPFGSSDAHWNYMFLSEPDETVDDSPELVIDGGRIGVFSVGEEGLRYRLATSDNPTQPYHFDKFEVISGSVGYRDVTMFDGDPFVATQNGNTITVHSPSATRRFWSHYPIASGDLAGDVSIAGSTSEIGIAFHDEEEGVLRLARGVPGPGQDWEVRDVAEGGLKVSMAATDDGFAIAHLNDDGELYISIVHDE